MNNQALKHLYTVAEAAQLMRVGRTRFYEILKSGRISAIKNGKTTLIRGDAIARWIDNLPEINTLNGGQND